MRVIAARPGDDDVLVLARPIHIAGAWASFPVPSGKQSQFACIMK
jgi:hypothetical protein